MENKTSRNYFNSSSKDNNRYQRYCQKLLTRKDVIFSVQK